MQVYQYRWTLIELAPTSLWTMKSELTAPELSSWVERVLKAAERWYASP